MLFYIGIFGFCFLMLIFSCLTKNKKVKNILAIITLSVLCIISGTRYNTGGTDYYIYKHVYDNLPSNILNYKTALSNNNMGMEDGFIIYSLIIKSLGFNFYGFTLIHSIIIFLLIYLALRKYDYNINFIIILFLYKFFFYNTFISMRQPISIVIFWLSLPLLTQKKYIKYYILCLIAFIFHRSSIILFAIPLITHFKISKKTFAIIMIVGLIAYITRIGSYINIQSILSNLFANDSAGILRIESYSTGGSGMSIFYLLEYYLLAIFLYIGYDKIYDYNEDSALFVKLFICLVPFFTIFSNLTIVTRLKDFFFLAYPIIIIYIAKTEKKMNVLIYLTAIIISFYGYMRYLVNFDNGALFHYQTFLNKDIDIIE